MKEKTTPNLEFFKKEWDTILAYERYNYQKRKNTRLYLYGADHIADRCSSIYLCNRI